MGLEPNWREKRPEPVVPPADPCPGWGSGAPVPNNRHCTCYRGEWEGEPRVCCYCRKAYTEV